MNQPVNEFYCCPHGWLRTNCNNGGFFQLRLDVSHIRMGRGHAYWDEYAAVKVRSACRLQVSHQIHHRSPGTDEIDQVNHGVPHAIILECPMAPPHGRNLRVCVEVLFGTLVLSDPFRFVVFIFISFCKFILVVIHCTHFVQARGRYQVHIQVPLRFWRHCMEQVRCRVANEETCRVRFRGDASAMFYYLIVHITRSFYDICSFSLCHVSPDLKYVLSGATHALFIDYLFALLTSTKKKTLDDDLCTGRSLYAMRGGSGPRRKGARPS